MAFSKSEGVIGFGCLGFSNRVFSGLAELVRPSVIPEIPRTWGPTRLAIDQTIGPIAISAVSGSI
ncbi:hypothetical protein C7271_09890 [filamentous cyanobacterium CCP5]|nr:hypothetical protein C7271_09890 [filamentous cyanobacterium CCP5]